MKRQTKQQIIDLLRKKVRYQQRDVDIISKANVDLDESNKAMRAYTQEQQKNLEALRAAVAELKRYREMLDQKRQLDASLPNL